MKHCRLCEEEFYKEEPEDGLCFKCHSELCQLPVVDCKRCLPFYARLWQAVFGENVEFQDEDCEDDQ